MHAAPAYAFLDDRQRVLSSVQGILVLVIHPRMSGPSTPGQLFAPGK
jgi:hypothetical protein